MEAPTCPRCGTRHWTTQPCPADIVTSPALKQRVKDAIEKSAVREKAAPSIDAVLRGALRRSTKTVGVMVPVDEKGEPVCPVCEARKARDAVRAKRYREKRGRP